LVHYRQDLLGLSSKLVKQGRHQNLVLHYVVHVGLWLALASQLFRRRMRVVGSVCVKHFSNTTRVSWLVRPCLGKGLGPGWGAGPGTLPIALWPTGSQILLLLLCYPDVAKHTSPQSLLNPGAQSSYSLALCECVPTIMRSIATDKPMLVAVQIEFAINCLLSRVAPCCLWMR
jgi:hypothetical protein